MNNNTTWERACGSEQIALPTDQKRRFFYPSPVLREDISGLVDYESCDDIGVSISLFYRKYAVRHYVECLVKQAFWLIKHLCERTDMADERVGVRLGITTDIRCIAMPYIEACNFPLHLVDWLESKEDTVPDSTRIIHMKDSFADVARILRMDVAHHIETNPTQFKGTWFHNLKAIWTDQPMAFRTPLRTSKSQGNRDRDDRLRVADDYNSWWGEDVPPGNHPLWQAVSKMTGDSPEESKSFFMKNGEDDEIMYVWGHFYGVSRYWLDTVDMETEIFPVMIPSGEEFALEVHAYKQGWTNDDVVNMEPAWNWKGASEPIEPYSEYGIRSAGESTNILYWMEQYK